MIRLPTFTLSGGRRTFERRIFRTRSTDENATLDITLSTAEAKRTLRFIGTSLNGKDVVLVSEVALDSSALEAGVVPGIRLMAISDPIREDEIWYLDGNSTSVGKIRQILRLRRSSTVRMVFRQDPDVDKYVQTVSESLSMTVDESEDEVSASTSDDLIYEIARRGQDSQSNKRMQARREMLDKDDRRDNTPVLLFVIAVFALPAIAGLLFAWSNGFLEVRPLS